MHLSSILSQHSGTSDVRGAEFKSVLQSIIYVIIETGILTIPYL